MKPRCRHTSSARYTKAIPPWDRVSGILIDGLPQPENNDTYAILRLQEGARQEVGWYAIKSEPIQRADLLVIRPDGWCRGLAFIKDKQYRCCFDMGEAYKHIEDDRVNHP